MATRPQVCTFVANRTLLEKSGNWANGNQSSVSRSLAVKWERRSIPVVAMCGLVMAILVVLGKRSFGVH
jgi:hypothetical protein